MLRKVSYSEVASGHDVVDCGGEEVAQRLPCGDVRESVSAAEERPEGVGLVRTRMQPAMTALISTWYNGMHQSSPRFQAMYLCDILCLQVDWNTFGWRQWLI